MLTRRTLLSCALSPLAACSLPVGSAPASRTLAAYRDEAEMTLALTRWRSAAEARQSRDRRSTTQSDTAMMMAAPAPMMAAAPAAEKSAGTAASESITNVQTAGVDEGGIVKRAGDYLIVLRRGRLFTIRVGGKALEASAACDAFAPGIDPQGAWYDELLVSGSTVVVVGFSYAHGGTEIGLFSLGEGGVLSHRATYHLRSFDYYSSRNYASRLIGNRLIFYTPTVLSPWGPPPDQTMPGVRRWRGQGTPAGFERILPATRVYRTDDDFDPAQPLALHTVTSCELGGGEIRCESTAVLGPAGRVFYVSPGSVYVWTSAQRRRGDAQSAVFRLPLDGAAPTALKAAGVPIDQLSFLEDGEGRLNVLLRDGGAGEGMWGAEGASAGRLALLRVPLTAFGDGRGSAGAQHYQTLPEAPAGSLQNRFVGDWLLWGGSGTGSPREANGGTANAWALRFASGLPPQGLAPGHAVERIEAMGRQAVLVGNHGDDLCFSSVSLNGSTARLAGRYTQPGASQGETRTHGFFFRPTGDDAGLLGLPVLQPSGRRNSHGVFAAAQGSAAVLYLRQQGTAFERLGTLASTSARLRDDGCRASCVDWYGNARPIFIGERVFALLGYELVEGRLAGGLARASGIEEARRIDFSPAALTRPGRYSPFG